MGRGLGGGRERGVRSKEGCRRTAIRSVDVQLLLHYYISVITGMEAERPLDYLIATS